MILPQIPELLPCAPTSLLVVHFPEGEVSCTPARLIQTCQEAAVLVERRLCDLP